MATPYDRAIEDSLIEKLSELRRQTGQNRSQVAAKVGVTEATIRAWENGLGFPRTLARLRRLAFMSGAKLEIKLTTKDGEEFLFPEEAT